MFNSCGHLHFRWWNRRVYPYHWKFDSHYDGSSSGILQALVPFLMKWSWLEHYLNFKAGRILPHSNHIMLSWTYVSWSFGHMYPVFSLIGLLGDGWMALCVEDRKWHALKHDRFHISIITTTITVVIHSCFHQGELSYDETFFILMHLLISSPPVSTFLLSVSWFFQESFASFILRPAEDYYLTSVHDIHILPIFLAVFVPSDLA